MPCQGIFTDVKVHPVVEKKSLFFRESKKDSYGYVTEEINLHLERYKNYKKFYEPSDGLNY